MDLFNQTGDNSTGNFAFDASRYTFFGNDVVEEAELGGLENEDEELHVAAVEEDFAFDNEKAEVLRTLSNVDDLASTFSKLNRDPVGYRSTISIADNESRQNIPLMGGIMEKSCQIGMASEH